MKSLKTKSGKQLFLISVFILPLMVFSQGGTWVWVRGSNTTNPQTVSPVQGIADSTYDPPAMQNAASWTDLNGNFWLLGGVFNYSTLYQTSDLWEYNPGTNKWTWVNGVTGEASASGIYGTRGMPSDTTRPGARDNAATWTDNEGNLWLFGGWGDAETTFGYLNDLWKYNIATNQWTWENGSNEVPSIDSDESAAVGVYGLFQQPSPYNTPGGRYGAVTWVDNNNDLWLFGGARFENGTNTNINYNDLWRFNITTNEWTWMNGPNGTKLAGDYNYGIKGIENPDNIPPARENATSWRDGSGNFYLFGGGTFPYNFETPSAYNDVWRYNPVTNMWAWLAGDSANNPAGKYLEYCTDTGNVSPAARTVATSCQAICASNAAFIFGGEYFNSNDPLTSVCALNDFWLFDTHTNLWKWLSGTTTPNDSGNYGIQGIASPLNFPPARVSASQWIDNKGQVWIFGGSHYSYYTEQYPYLYNDLWKFIPDTACIEIPLVGGLYYSVSKNNICKGDTVLLTLTGDVNAQVSPNAFITRIDSIHLLLYPDTTTVYTISGQSYCGNPDSQSITISVYTSFQVQVIASDSIFCPGDSVSLEVPYGYNSYLWSNGDTNSYTYVKQGGSYDVTVTENPACSALSDTVVINTIATMSVPFVQSGDTLTAHGETSYEWFRNGTEVLSANARQHIYVASEPGTYTIVSVDSNGCTVSSGPIIISGIQDISDMRLNIYPNPANTKLYCTVNGIAQNSIVQIISADGNIVIQTIQVKTNAFEIDISTLAAGLYFLVMQSDDESWMRKFVKE